MSSTTERGVPPLWRTEVSREEYLQHTTALASVRAELVELHSVRNNRLAEAMPFLLHTQGAPADFIRACQAYVQKRIEFKEAEEAWLVAFLAVQSIRPQ